MHVMRLGAIVALGLSLLSLGCGNGLKDENASLKAENRDLKAQLANANTALANANDPVQQQALRNELAQRDARIRELEAQLRKPEPGGKSDPGIAGIETSYDRHTGEMTVNLPADILFASGSADLKPSSQATLNKVVAALRKDYAGKKIRVEGHTDSDPISRSKDKWADNLDLSLNRAAAVTRYLIDKRIDKKQIATVGYGDARLKKTKAGSRRVEIVVLVG